MTQILSRPRDEQVMYVVETDSMGRTPEQIEAMEKNELRPHRLSKRDKAYAERVSKECASYPKVMYRLALRKGCPAGDEKPMSEFPQLPRRLVAETPRTAGDQGERQVGHLKR